MQTRLSYLGLLLACLSTSAHAELNKCKGANGHIVVQDAPCPSPRSAAPARLPTLAERNALAKQQKQQEKDQKFADNRPGANWDLARKPGAPLQLGTPTLPSKLTGGESAYSDNPSRSPNIDEQNRQTARNNARIEAENSRTRAQNRVTECQNSRIMAGLRGRGNCG